MLTYDTADGKWKPAAGGGGGLSFPQILAALAAEGWTFDAATGLVVLSAPILTNGQGLTIEPPSMASNAIALQINAPFGTDDNAKLLDATRLAFGGGPDGGPAWYANGSYAQTLSSLAAADADIAEWNGLDGTTRFRLAHHCWPILRASSTAGDREIPDADLIGRDVGLWYDPSNGAALLMVKAKTVDGSVVTCAIPISNGTLATQAAFDDHSARHENGGADEISIAGLDGVSAELAAHLADAADAHDASAISILDAASDFTATDVEGALAELQSDAEAHVAAADPHAGYVLESLIDAKGDLIAGSAADTVARLAAGTDFAASLVPDSSTATGLRWGKPRSGLRPTGSLFETFSRAGPSIGGQTFLVSQRVGMVAIDLPLGLSVASISFMSGGTAAVTPTIQFFGLYDSARALLRASVDDGSTAWAGNAVKTLALSSAFVTTYSGLHYLGILVVAGTVPNIMCTAPNANPQNIPPIMAGSSNTGVNALPNPANAIAALALTPWAWVS